MLILQEGTFNDSAYTRGHSQIPLDSSDYRRGIAITFVIGMGWYGYDEVAQPNTVATVGPYKVSKDEYLRAKRRYYRFYRDQLKQKDIKDETLQQLAINGLVATTSWRMMADNFNLGRHRPGTSRCHREAKGISEGGQFRSAVLSTAPDCEPHDSQSI